MTNELTTETTPKPAISSGGALAALVPQNLDDAFRLARALSSSGDMVPKHFQGKPEATMAAIIRGMEIGLAPMQALSNIAVINGRASVWGDALPALMQRAGHALDSWIEGEGDKMVAYATLERGDTGKITKRSFSAADAKAAGLWNKQGPWQNYKPRMLQLRARSFACRDGAADALMGLQVAEEMRDAPPLRDVSPPEGGLAARAAAARAAAQAPAEPEPEQEQEDRIEDAEEIPVGDEEAMFDRNSLEFAEGETARREDKAFGDCPFEPDTAEEMNWRAGWNAMDAEMGEGE